MTDILVKKCANGWIVEPLSNSNNVQDDTFVYRTIDGLIQDLPKLLGEGQPSCGFCEKTGSAKDCSTHLFGELFVRRRLFLRLCRELRQKHRLHDP